MVAHSGLITVMQRAARKAAPRLRRDFGEVEQLQVSRKGPADFVSMADKRAEATIVDELKNARPDWGMLLVLVGERLGKDTILTRAHLEPTLVRGGSGKTVASSTSARFAIEGVGRSHDAVSRLAMDLEAKAIFPSVRIVQTRRIVHDGADAVAFQIDCTLEGLPGGER